MPRPAGRTDGQETRAPRATGVLRGGGFAIAVALGAVAVWLIVTSTTQKRLELGVLAGLWGLLLGAFCAFGTRRGQRDELAVPVAGGQELTVRGVGYVERADESAARRHFEARLEQMLRQEIQTTLGREIASLREEVASLRNDLLEKVGGQLRLERIETTRVIGSDIEALQREIDQLKNGRPVVDASGPITRTIPRIIEPAQPVQQAPARVQQSPVQQSPVVQPAVVQPAVLQAEPARQQPVTQPVQPEPAARPAQPQPVQEQEASDQQPPARPVQRQPVQEPAQPVQQQAQEQSPVDGGDFFADLPRLRPFTDFELDPVLPSASATDGADTGGQGSAASAEAEDQRPPLRAPRRPESGPAAAGRHGRSDDAGSGGGRRRRAADDEDNVLARILARENAR
jgi:hypothetical protein